MSNASEYMNVQLVVERTFDAPRDRVFRAWIDPERMIKWFAPVGMRPVNIEVEAHVGGKYQIGMQEPDGRTIYATGEYVEIAAPNRLVFTWSWLAEQRTENSLVTVEFIDRGGSTHIVLTHERLRTAEIKEGNRDGWSNCFESLHQYLMSGDI